MAKTTKTEEKKPIYNSQQACLELRIVGHYRSFVMKKYSGQLMTLDLWKERLKGEGLVI